MVNIYFLWKTNFFTDFFQVSKKIIFSNFLFDIHSNHFYCNLWPLSYLKNIVSTISDYRDDFGDWFCIKVPNLLIYLKKISYLHINPNRRAYFDITLIELHLSTFLCRISHQFYEIYFKNYNISKKKKSNYFFKVQ